MAPTSSLESPHNQSKLEHQSRAHDRLARSSFSTIKRQAVTAAIVLQSIAAPLSAEQIAVDTIIDANNIAQHAHLLDETLVQLISEGAFELEVTATESFAPHPGYQAGTELNAGSVSLGPGAGDLLGYQSGRPFAAPPSADDPRAGDKIAWNMRHAYLGDSSEIAPFFWQYRNMRNGKLERELSFAAKGLKFKHRVLMDPIPDLPNNPAEIFNGLYLQVLSPPDLRNTQLLIHRLEDDTKQEQGWLYLGTQRRVRRLPTGQNTDAFLGSDIMIEDFLGYNGRIMDMTWRYVETKKVLLPFYRHNDLQLSDRSHVDGYHFIDFGGKGDCFPKIKWQFREAHVLEASPTWSQHPLSKRLYYVDTETYFPAYGRLYDRGGKLWKFAIAGYSHPDHHIPENAGSHVPIIDTVSMIDLQAQHCTTLQFHTVVNSVGPKASQFSVQELRKIGK